MHLSVSRSILTVCVRAGNYSNYFDVAFDASDAIVSEVVLQRPCENSRDISIMMSEQAILSLYGVTMSCAPSISSFCMSSLPVDDNHRSLHDGVILMMFSLPCCPFASVIVIALPQVDVDLSPLLPFLS